jgi:hypothetical protein
VSVKGMLLTAEAEVLGKFNVGSIVEFVHVVVHDLFSKCSDLKLHIAMNELPFQKLPYWLSLIIQH